MAAPAPAPAAPAPNRLQRLRQIVSHVKVVPGSRPPPGDVCASVTKGLVEDHSFVSTLDASTQEFVVIWPGSADSVAPDAKEGQPPDALIALHGHGSDRWQFVQAARGECAGARDVAERHGMVYISPDYRATTSWAGPQAEADLVQLIHLLREGECGPVRRVLLCGASMGGTAALTFAVRHPHLLDGVVSMNGVADLTTYSNYSDAIFASFVSLGGNEQHERRLRSATFHPERLLGLPLATTTGGQDEAVPPASTLQLMEVLTKQGESGLSGPTLSIHRPLVGHETDYADTVTALEFVIASLSHKNITIRSSFANSLRRCYRDSTASRPCKVAFMGGSITQMDGYRPIVSDWLAERFPSQEFEFVSAGISSTCSTTGAFRLESDVLRSQPDLFFLEFAVNDDGDACYAERECIRGMEGIIRHTRETQPFMDIIVVYFVNESMLAQIQAGQTPLTVEAHERVCRHYGVSSVYLAKKVAERLSAGALSWEEYGGVHPAPLGNRLAAGLCTELLATAWGRESRRAATTLVAHRLPPVPLDDGSYVRGRWLSPAAGVPNGLAWIWTEPEWADIQGTLRDTFAGQPLLCCGSGSAGADECEVRFDGNTFGAFVLAGPDAGVLECSIDRGKWTATDLRHRHSASLHYPRTVMLATDMEQGQHVARLRLQPPPAGAAPTAARILQFAVN